jgi:hypothetical protein
MRRRVLFIRITNYVVAFAFLGFVAADTVCIRSCCDEAPITDSAPQPRDTFASRECCPEPLVDARSPLNEPTEHSCSADGCFCCIPVLPNRATHLIAVRDERGKQVPKLSSLLSPPPRGTFHPPRFS